ncbi:uncharacterized protein LOC107788313 [Nicotiana tabacum]|uniref:Uncharacterized protein LOC107788313 n=1 Tax=Nicotiana tabacum TaxID=4097 RepID=A0A1S3ZLR2_TOBAC|nr:PREDICTED: uncharacterized protein LOC107788313 [Nicotiana tabacum]
MEEKNQHLLQPLIKPTTKNSAIYPSSNLEVDENNHKSTSSKTSIILRLVVVIFAIVVSLWANYEASKGFSITIVNEADATFAKRRFDLFFVSNDEATRLVLKTSKFVENILYPTSDVDFGQSQNKKLVKHVILRLSSRNMTRPIIVESRDNNVEFVLHISPSILYSPNYKHAMSLALQKGMARIWLWNGQGNAPASLVNGMIEYIASLASSGRATSESESVEPVTVERSCWKSKNSRTIAKFLNYCEGKREGFVRRLNQAMKNGWHEKMIGDALGIPAWYLCETYNSSGKLLNYV